MGGGVMKYSNWSKPKKERFINSWLQLEDVFRDGIYGRERKDFIALEKNLINSRLLDFSNHFKVQDVMRHYFNGEHLYSVETWGMFLYLNYKNIQTRLSWIMEKEKLYNYTDAERFSLGLTCENPEMFHASFTHDLDKIEVRA